MPRNLQAWIDQQAHEHGIPVELFRIMLGQESGGRQRRKDGSIVTSPRGARGIGQLMPGTARSLGVNPDDPYDNVRGAAMYLSQQYRKFGRWDLALSAYNSGPGGTEGSGKVEGFGETQSYVKNIMARWGGDPKAVVAGSSSGRTPGSGPGSGGSTPSPAAPFKLDISAIALDAIRRRASGGEDPVDTFSATTRAITQQRAAYDALPKPQNTSSPAPGRATAPSEGPADPLHAGGGWGGSYGVAVWFRDVALATGLQVVSEKRQRQSTKSGGVSDHWEGSKGSYAFDLSNGSKPTPQMDAAVTQMLRRLGVQYEGGPVVVTKTVGDYRIQILYRTQVGGNHNNHIHVGVRRVGGGKKT